MEEPDFSGIDPVRVPEARRRIAAIREYLALPDPTTADAIRIGQSVGLSRWTFVRLVQAWNEHRDARRLVMDRRGNSGRASIIDQSAATIVDEAIREFGADAKLAVIARRIADRCAEAGVAVPADTTIWQRMRKVRVVTGAPASGPPRVIVGRMWFQMPVEDQAVPMALVAVMLPERLIVAYRVSIDPVSPPAVTELVRDLADRRADVGEARALLMNAEDLRAATAQLDSIGQKELRPQRRSLQIELSRAFGGRIRQLKTAYRPGTGATRKAGVRQAQPLTAAEAVVAVETAIDAHNAAMGAAMPAFTFAPGRA
ncbi:MAG: hypothetical protein EOP66_01715 [Sphingomonas sp.]|nr:MAG: hypothetical protein EOP66_01715 [Sphingomonas sp.]